MHLVWVLVAALLMAAHFLRFMVLPLALLTLLLPFLLFFRRAWAVRVQQLWLVLGTLMWVGATRRLVLERLAHGEPYLRLALILGALALFSAGAVTVLELRPLRRLLRRTTL
jgi:hypothetical protein